MQLIARRIVRYSLITLLSLAVLFALGRYSVMVYGGQYHGVRAPYLQLPSPTTMGLRWQTPNSEVGVLQLGTAAGVWGRRVLENHAAEQHAIDVTGLTPATRYYYAVGSEQRMYYGGDALHFFETPPLPGSALDVRAVVLGDPGYAQDGAQARVTQSVQAWLTQHPRPGRADFDLLLATGDQAYTSGSNPQFQSNFFIPYQPWLAQVPIWPTYGNHDARRFAYFHIFDLPAAGQSGGVASGTEHYYAFDHGQVHVVVLDSQDSNLSTGGSMYQWLEKDLQANRQPWLLAMFHHPPYSKGSHDSDQWRDSWGRLVEMRAHFVPLLERYGVDLVLSGHSHMYERSVLLDCHYDVSKTLTPAMILSQEANGHYIKTGPIHSPHQGAVYAVVGSSAKLDDGPLNHPVMARSLHERGALLLDIQAETLQGNFVNEQGRVSDSFSITKNTAQPALNRDSCQSN
ncbi:MAG: metallophosphoesterase family protein [Gammaproteobacteria bacterium]|nr:metallophosphoesterase family protein [Gammaproteobacteria bacterium]